VQRGPPHLWAAPGATLTRCARAAQEAQAAKVSLRTRAGGALSDCNDSARSLAAPRHGVQGVEGACRFLYQTQDPWCAQPPHASSGRQLISIVIECVFRTL